ncbi:MAG TPA: SAM-dependent chlorinase/fluorinase [Pyrinomonadaceae bacterium]|nr:SAM-dependent chlorinase/fluorinase [Pyrinomonadaceae bacterium]
MIVTLLTDFGTADHFVGAVKGALLSVNPAAQVVDITHEIPPHDIEAGAFALLAAFEAFPAGTVHVAVVDPGVGSPRRPVVASGGEQFFVGPDNGVLGYVYERLDGLRVFHVTNEKYFRREVSATFHGRDVFAPVAGALSLGVEPDELGEEITDFVRLAFAAPERREDGILVGRVIHIDRFGNCITNISPRDFVAEDVNRGARLLVEGREVRAFRRFFADEADAPGVPFAIWGSAGLLEIAVFLDSAARLLGVGRGGRVEIRKTVNRKS